MTQPQSKIGDGEKSATILHVVYSHEGFEEAAQTLFKLVQQTERKAPGKPRNLYLDIDGHKNELGGSDEDMFELQRHFVGEFLAQFLTEIHTPLFDFVNPKPQVNDIPPSLTITSKKN